MSNTFTIPGWLLLLSGIAIGHSNVLSGGLVENLLSSFQSVVNLLLVPVYTFCVLLYLVRLVLVEFSIGKTSSVRPSTLAPPAAVVVPTVTEADDGVFNLSGSYKLISNDNFEGFLETQGVPWALRRAANQARPLHKITHVGKTITIQIKGIIESETTYEVDGPPIQTKIRSRVFEDRMKFLETGDGIEVTKTALEENYTVTVTRRLSKDRQTITLTSRAIFNDDRDPVQSVQVFRRVE
jgi:hypothetical protein